MAKTFSRRGLLKRPSKPIKSFKEKPVKILKKEYVEEVAEEKQPVKGVVETLASVVGKCSECGEPVAPGQTSVCVKHQRSR